MSLDLSSIEGHKRIDIIHQLALMSGFAEKVPTIDQFIEDPYYLGKVLGNGMYPIWRRALRQIFPTPYYSPVNEIILSGGIGLGKSTAALAITLYDVCKILCLENPHKYYNLIESTVISYALMNATKSLAGGILYGQMVDWIEASPFFKSKLANNKRTLFRNNIDISIGSRGRDYLGAATIHAIFSEVNDMTVVGNQAVDNVDTISTRRLSRFNSKTRSIFGHLIFDSSNKGNRSFIDMRVDEKIKNGDTDYIIFAYSHWEAKEHTGNYTGERFEVFCGSEHSDPFIITDENKDKLANLHEPKIITVPVEHRFEFQVNLVKSLRDLAGISTFSTFSFISSNEILLATFSRPNIAKKAIIELDFFDQTQTLDQFIDIKMCMFTCRSPRFIHIDLGIKHDSTGIACSYLDGYKDTTRFDSLTGDTVINREPNFVTEWVLEIRAVPGHEVPIYKIREFLLGAKKIGYPISLVSTDGYQSTNLRQDLVLKGINSELISVDRYKDPYNYLRNCILEGRLSAPSSSKLIEEVRTLQENDAKFDHSFDGCFTGDTEITLVRKDTKEFVFKKLQDVSELDYSDYYTISYDLETNNFVLSEFKNCRVTKEVTQLLEVELESGEVFQCTPEHLILTKTGYVKAENLTGTHDIISY